MAQRKRRATKAKTKRAKATSGRRPKRKAAAAARKKPRRSARPAAPARPDRNAARVAELEAENQRLREELERVRAELGDRPAAAVSDDFPSEEPPQGY